MFLSVDGSVTEQGSKFAIAQNFPAIRDRGNGDDCRGDRRRNVNRDGRGRNIEVEAHIASRAKTEDLFGQVLHHCFEERGMTPRAVGDVKISVNHFMEQGYLKVGFSDLVSRIQVDVNGTDTKADPIETVAIAFTGIGYELNIGEQTFKVFVIPGVEEGLKIHGRSPKRLV